ncbi:hypothetical protein [Bacillus sp. es.034]|uniref:hypothetical protein n=1 Tax=Bacillus sp. es.034 TaxID=1761763 RepID=UPI000BF89A8E|nr:hypothetical protein [Bacillus sp. es.034]PFG04511.1 hypothetical protein ATG71_1264 [Bacillus sp. es.034]
MKKVLVLVLIFLFCSAAPSMAAEPTILKEADIQVKAGSDKQYQITENVSLFNATGIEESISHTFSNLESSQIDNLIVSANGQELEYVWEKGESLSKLLVTPPENVPDEFTYQLQYDLSLQENVYTTPLFVPMFPAQGNSNIVHITFEAPEGEQVHKNSFPVVIEDVGNKVDSHIMNIPSHVKYVFGDGAGTFNVFNVTSWAVIIALIAVIAVWFRSEVSKKKGVAA